MGRPPLDARDRKSAHLSVRLTEEEYRGIERTARATGRSIPEWTRSVILAAVTLGDLSPKGTARSSRRSEPAKGWRRWSDDDDLFLRASWQLCTAAEIATMMARSLDSVRARAADLRLQREPGWRSYIGATGRGPSTRNGTSR